MNKNKRARIARFQRRRQERRHRLVRRGLVYSLLLAFAILVLGGVGFWVIDPLVNSFQDGFWLAFTTAATVGYGDMVPSTHASRVFSVVVVLLGLAVLSLVTASLAAIFVEKDVEEEEKQIELDMMRELAAMRHDLQVMRALLEQASVAGEAQRALYRSAQESAGGQPVQVHESAVE